MKHIIGVHMFDNKYINDINFTNILLDEIVYNRIFKPDVLNTNIYKLIKLNKLMNNS